MNSTALITNLARRGIQLKSIGPKLRVEGPADQLTADIEAMLRDRKTELLTHVRERVQRRLSELEPTWRLEWRKFWNERAGVLEYEGNMSRAEAEEWAFHELLAKMVAEFGVLYVPFSSPTADILGLASALDDFDKA